MELKLIKSKKISNRISLLIVLNGIEMQLYSESDICRGLLIVLNGIEIHNQDIQESGKYLLIVLNGIEMHSHQTNCQGQTGF